MFDEEPGRDPHDHCHYEIQRLTVENKRLEQERSKYKQICQQVIDRFPHPNNATDWAKGRYNLAREILLLMKESEAKK